MATSAGELDCYEKWEYAYMDCQILIAKPDPAPGCGRCRTVYECALELVPDECKSDDPFGGEES